VFKQLKEGGRTVSTSLMLPSGVEDGMTVGVLVEVAVKVAVLVGVVCSTGGNSVANSIVGVIGKVAIGVGGIGVCVFASVITWIFSSDSYSVTPLSFIFIFCISD